MYEKVRKERATKVQQASARATDNVNERIGFTSQAPHEMSLAAAEGKLTCKCLCPSVGGKILTSPLTDDEVCSYKMHDHIAAEVGAGRGA